MSRSNTSRSFSSETCDSSSDDYTDQINDELEDSDVIPMFSNRRMRINSSDDDHSSDNDVSMRDESINSIFTELPSETDFPNDLSIFFAEPGLRHAPSRDSEPLKYFELFFTTLLGTIVTETNRYAQQFIDSTSGTLKQKSHVMAWKPVTLLEVKAFIAVILEMRITRRPNIFSYWTTSSREIPCFRKMFARNRFQIIIRFFIW